MVMQYAQFFGVKFLPRLTVLETLHVFALGPDDIVITEAMCYLRQDNW
jgi:hypothetical protein